MNKIGIIGQGFVGNAVYQKFKKYYQILTYDLDETKATATEEEVLSCNVLFLCLPTPMHMGTGECDISIVASILGKIINLNQRKVVVIKSTVPPLTVASFNKITPKHIQVVFNPEFLTERNAVEDYEDDYAYKTVRELSAYEKYNSKVEEFEEEWKDDDNHLKKIFKDNIDPSVLAFLDLDEDDKLLLTN